MRLFFWGAIPMLFLLNGCAPSVVVHKPLGPQVELVLSKTKVTPGHVLRITAKSEEPGLALQVLGWDQAIILSPVPGAKGEMEGFLAIPLEAEPGRVKLVVSSPGSGSEEALLVPVEVIPRAPDPTVRLNIKNFSRLPYGQESQIMAKVRNEAAVWPAPRLGPWQWPVKGRLSEPFGVLRVYNKGQGSWRHGGYDISAPGGTPVLAPGPGRVLFTASFEAHGNTILMDHGYGVITTYLHLRAILVKPGDPVRAGQAIGEVGSTGGSTGDHLHFQVNVNGRIAAPEDFLSGEKP
jgi:hypothetical protein